MLFLGVSVNLDDEGLEEKNVFNEYCIFLPLVCSRDLVVGVGFCLRGEVHLRMSCVLCFIR